MSECQVCTGRAELFLCSPHIAELRDNLTRLVEGPYIPAANGRTKSGGKWCIERRSPGLLANLSDVALCRTHIGTRGGHRKRGDEIRGLYEPDTEKGRQTRQGTAGGLLDAVKNGLGVIVRDICESRGGLPQRMQDAAQMASWLALNVHAVACDESAGQYFAEAERFVRAIERLIDLPNPMRFLGKCPTWNDQKREICGTELRCRQDAVEVFCRNCRQTHSPDRLQLLMMNDLEYKKLTFDKILKANRTQPEEYRISERTLRHWRQHGKLKPRGWLRPNGQKAITRHGDEDEPLYLWADVRKLRAEKPVKKAKAG